MIVNANIVTDNVIKYNNELSLLVYRACRTISKAACEGKYYTYVKVDSLINDVVDFLYNELGYIVHINEYNHNQLFVSWYEQVDKHIECDDYLTAKEACRITNRVSKSYDNICMELDSRIMNCSKNGQNYYNYDISGVPSSVVQEVKETLWSAGYKVEVNDNRLMIKWEPTIVF